MAGNMHLPERTGTTLTESCAANSRALQPKLFAPCTLSRSRAGWLTYYTNKSHSLNKSRSLNKTHSLLFRIRAGLLLTKSHPASSGYLNLSHTLLRQKNTAATHNKTSRVILSN